MIGRRPISLYIPSADQASMILPGVPHPITDGVIYCIDQCGDGFNDSDNVRCSGGIAIASLSWDAPDNRNKGQQHK